MLFYNSRYKLLALRKSNKMIEESTQEPRLPQMSPNQPKSLKQTNVLTSFKRNLPLNKTFQGQLSKLIPWHMRPQRDH